ncbi:hypothetical protein GCM10010232_69420 [Streptomyces amakusaensis]|uniref:Uncharacterized protein n=1 Tax=Streptomyces amakusaensis TaxID=67271 RepID=A0ABW0AVF0_9ACTN
MAHDKTPGSPSGNPPGGPVGRPARRPKQRARGGPRPTGDRPATRSEARTALRREVVSTVGVLADATDFAAMRRYRTFAFHDHRVYLREVEDLLKSLTTDRLHTTVALFDPQDFAAYCETHDLDPDTALSRSKYTAGIAERGSALPYGGEPLDRLLPRLVDTAVRRATWEYATALLADIGECADCGQDIGRAALDRASHLLTRLLTAAGPGRHHVVCSVRAPDEHLLAVLHITNTDAAADGDAAEDGEGDDPPAAARFDAAESAEFVTVLATAIALENPGGVVLRTSAPGRPDRLHGWRLHQSDLVPLTEAEVFSAYCTDATTGEPISPEPGVEYLAGFDLGTDAPDSHH